MGVEMDFSKVSNDVLLSSTQRWVRNERKSTHVLLWHFNEMESRRLYAEMKYPSMFECLVKFFGYDEKGAYQRVHASRLLRQIPELSEKIENGSLHLTQMALVRKCINQEKKEGRTVSLEQTKKVFEQIENQTGKETQKILAVEFNQPIQMHEIVKPQRDNSSRLELTFSEESMKKAALVKNHLSHVLPGGNYSDLFVHLLDKELKRICGKEKVNSTAENEKFPTQSKEVVSEQITSKREVSSRQENVDKLTKAKLTSSQAKGNVESSTGKNQKKDVRDESAKKLMRRFGLKRKREYIPVKLRRACFGRAGFRCEFVDANGARCDCGAFLNLDHVIPLSLGGTNRLDNLRVLCQAHNLREARRMGLWQPKVRSFRVT
jgi:5-methylcytosine-specific restriction endonuclease McrA